MRVVSPLPLLMMLLRVVVVVSVVVLKCCYILLYFVAALPGVNLGRCFCRVVPFHTASTFVLPRDIWGKFFSPTA